MYKHFQRILLSLFLFLPIVVLAQSGDVPIPTESPKGIPAETPVSVLMETPSSVVSTPVTDDSVPRVTPTPVISSSTILLSPRPSSVILTTPGTTPIASVSPIPSPSNTTAQVSSNLVLDFVLAIVAGIFAIFGFSVYQRKTQKNNDPSTKFRTSKDDRCGSIRDLLEQKKKELEESLRNWPEEKIKSLAQGKVIGELKKNEDAKKVIETAESLKAKHDKLKKTIELLEKRYNLCILEFPSLNKIKTLKFKGFKAKLIAEGAKTATIRLFDEKDLKAGDNLELINSDDDKSFAKAEITEVIQKKLDEVDIIDLDGHEKWNNKEEMLESFKNYYGDKINLETIAKIIRFKIIK